MKAVRDKNRLIKELQDSPNISRACQKIGISRQTYYRWLQEDSDFAVGAQNAQIQGYESMIDFADSKLMNNVMQGNQRAIEYLMKRSDQKLEKRNLQVGINQYKTLAELIQSAHNHRQRSVGN